MIVDALSRLRGAPRRTEVRDAAAPSVTMASTPAALSVASTGDARNLSAVDACIQILCGSLGKMPAYVMDSGTRERIKHPILWQLNVRPNEAMTASIRKHVLEASRLEGGNGYDWIIRDPHTGHVQELIPIPWWLVHPWRDTNGTCWYTVTHPVTGTPMKLCAADVCHYKGATRDGLKGISVLQRAREVIATASAAQRYEQNYYENGGQPAGVLMTETDLGGYAQAVDGSILKDDAGTPVTLKDRMRQEWERVHAGPSNSHRIAILDLGLKYQALGSSNKDAQFVESKEVTVKDLARFFGVPLYKLQEGKQAYGSNEQNAIEYITSTLHPIVKQYEEEQTYKLLAPSDSERGLQIRYNMMAELRGDSAARGAWYSNMRNIGAFSVNDIRALEDMEDVPGGDSRLASLNYVPLDEWRELSRQRNQQTGGESE